MRAVKIWRHGRRYGTTPCRIGISILDTSYIGHKQENEDDGARGHEICDPTHHHRRALTRILSKDRFHPRRSLRIISGETRSLPGSRSLFARGTCSVGAVILLLSS